MFSNFSFFNENYYLAIIIKFRVTAALDINPNFLAAKAKSETRIKNQSFSCIYLIKRGLSVYQER